MHQWKAPMKNILWINSPGTAQCKVRSKGHGPCSPHYLRFLTEIGQGYPLAEMAIPSWSHLRDLQRHSSLALPASSSAPAFTGNSVPKKEKQLARQGGVWPVKPVANEASSHWGVWSARGCGQRGCWPMRQVVSLFQLGHDLICCSVLHVRQSLDTQ